MECPWDKNLNLPIPLQVASSAATHVSISTASDPFQVTLKRGPKNKRIRSSIFRQTVRNYKLCHYKERKTRYEQRKIRKFANVCAVLHNVCVHYKVENSEIQDLTPAAPSSYFDDDVDVSLEIIQLRQISGEIRAAISSVLSN